MTFEQKQCEVLTLYWTVIHIYHITAYHLQTFLTAIMGLSWTLLSSMCLNNCDSLSNCALSSFFSSAAWGQYCVNGSSSPILLKTWCLQVNVAETAIGLMYQLWELHLVALSRIGLHRPVYVMQHANLPSKASACCAISTTVSPPKMISLKDIHRAIVNRTVYPSIILWSIVMETYLSYAWGVKFLCLLGRLYRTLHKCWEGFTSWT